MNVHSDSSNLNTPERLEQELDRLVDGELSPARQQALLRHLEQLDGGWRRCALAFVEAQTWHQELGGYFDIEAASADANELHMNNTAQDSAAVPLAGSGLPTEPTQSATVAPWQRRLFTVLSMAASFALAFLLGFAVHRTPPGDAQLAGPLRSTPDDALATSQRPQPGGLAEFHSHDPPSAALPAATNPSWRHVPLLVNDNGTWQPVDLPAVDGVDAERWLAAQPSAVPEQWKEDLQRQGHTIQTRRELVPVDLGDGRRLVVPVENVEVQFVGGHRYQ